MSPIQQMLLGAGGAGAAKTYIDDIFSTYIYTATGSSGQQINNGVDLTEKGLVWFKGRSNAWSNALLDTERGGTKLLYTDLPNSEGTFTDAITSFNNNGFTTGTNQFMNYADTHTYASWTFKAVPGFMDVVTYTGNASAWNSGSQTLNHNLGCKPGLIIIKSRTQGGGSPSRDWYVWHRDISGNPIFLNYSNSKTATADPRYFNDPTNNPPTSTTFQVGDNVSGGGSYGGPAGFGANENGEDYIAYLFAGGESTAATAKSVKFDGDGDYLSFSDSDTAPGSGAFTLECWIRPDNTHTDNAYRRILRTGDNNATGHVALIWNSSSQRVTVNYNNTTLFTSGTKEQAPRDQWTHIALVREGTGSNQTKLYLNGVNVKEGTMAQDLTLHAWQIGTDTTLNATSFSFNGEISNVRLVVGTAVYTSSFRPPTAPLTNITNTELLCCNNSSTTGKTVGPTITANGNVAASTDSPFDDPDAFVFGDAGDQNVIKCGSYGGNTDDDGPEVFLGWEPQYLMIKNADTGSTPWQLWDSVRDVVTGGNDEYLRPDSSDSKASYERISFTSTGFKLDANSSYVNESGKKLIYIAIRRADGYVGKPVEAGTDVFAMPTGNGSSTIPNFTTNFVTDFATYRKPGAQHHWEQTARLMGTGYVYMNRNLVANTWDKLVFDSMIGFQNHSSHGSDYQAWAWKRHAGFDVVVWRGRGGSQTGSTAHSLNAVPEMIWSKRLDGDPGDWIVYHDGLNEGTNPEQYYLNLNDDGAESSAGGPWNNTAPTATHFSTGVWSAAGAMGQNDHMLTILFDTVEGISKVGKYTGTGDIGSGPNNAQTTGFSPRFLMFKRVDAAGGWYVFDTVRGLSSAGIPAGYDPYLLLEDDAAQGGTTNNPLNVTSTGFSFHSTNATATINIQNAKYIYYAHA